MPFNARAPRLAAGLAVLGLASGCVASAAPSTTTVRTGAATARATASRAPAAPKASVAAIDRLTAIARRRYATEVHGGVTIGTLRRVGRDRTLLTMLAAGRTSAATAYVRQQFAGVWYHWHVSRLRIMQGSKSLVEVGVPFVVAPSHETLRGPGGRALGTLQISIQDVIGFVRFMHRNYPVDVVVRGQGAGHVRSSLPAATNAALPSRGTVTLAGRRYLVRSFQQRAWNAEPITAWILTRG